MSESSGDLTASFQRLIANTGPLSLQHYMGESNARYYADKDPLGAAGDFVTAPEISQMFGELIGLWMADLWIRAGRDDYVHYVELGPGRGTLAKDALRAAKRYGLEPEVHLVEGSTALRDIQLEALPRAQFHHDLSTVPMEGTVLIIGNEFLDALPIRQMVKTADGWRERMVGFDERAAKFIPVAGTQPMDSAVPEDMRGLPDDTIIESCSGAAATMFEVAGRLNAQGGAALLIDYGHAEKRTGSTLQAIANHKKVDPFMAPGTADLTAHVDFATLAQIAQSRECKWMGTVTQGHFLRGLGIDQRAENLAKAAPQYAGELEAARKRLADDDQMGSLFKVMGLSAPSWPDGVGFA
ncbi:SAM-dependent methyltransferase [Altererythrobacter sp. ZODW24]|uniref:class I SAM-dependent methyltransferase n=1 Tax=Altererythrobacter sp. ZODW24 TaxID=2185142 RepID=UPI000DF86776|nr:SAM-dependent methyltransferase [Altererythrobacter sp. ZODW24]